LYKFDRNDGDAPFYFDYAGPDADLYVPHPFKPETHETDPQPQPIADMIRVVAESGDAVFRSAIAEYLDLAALVKHVAIEMFLNEGDGVLGNFGMNNFYLYRPSNGHLHVLIPWDKSDTMSDGASWIFHNVDDVPSDIQNRLMARAIAFPDLRTLYLDTLVACADSASEPDPDDPRGWLEREVERELEQIQDAVLTDPQKTYTNDQYLEAMEQLRQFAQQRSAYVKTAVAARR
jgi:hypothetical protein